MGKKAPLSIKKVVKAGNGYNQSTNDLMFFFI